MAMTHKFNVSFELTTVLSGEEIQALIAARGALKALKAANQPLPEAQKGRGEWLQRLFVSDKTDEEVVIAVVRDTIRVFLRESCASESSSTQTLKCGNVSVKVRDQQCNCNACHECRVRRESK